MSGKDGRTLRDESIQHMDGTALYRFFDAHDRLLYVGITSVPLTRWANHRLHAAWWPEAVTKHVEWFTERREAAAFELKAIRAEAPLWNTAAAPASNQRLAIARFSETTDGGIWTEEHGWRNHDVAVTQILAAEIRSGQLAAGERTPSISTLTRRFGVGANTARKAIQFLVEDGLAVAQGSGTRRRYFVAANIDDSDWRPRPLPDGRDALDALLGVLSSSSMCLAAAANRIGLHLSIVKGWGQRHPHVAKAIERAAEEGARRGQVL